MSSPEPEALPKMEQTLITIQDSNEDWQEISIDELLGKRIMSPPNPVSLPERMSPLKFVYPPKTDSQFDPLSLPWIRSSSESVSPLWLVPPLESMSPPESVSPPESLAKTEQILVRIQDLSKRNREIIIENHFSTSTCVFA